MKLIELSQVLTDSGISNEFQGDPELNLTSVNTLELAKQGEISFLANPKYKDQLSRTQASAVIIKPGEKHPASTAVIHCSDPYSAITHAIIQIHGFRQHPQWGIDHRAIIDESATVGENGNIAPFVTLSKNVVIGDNAVIYPGCYIAEDVTIGDNVTLFPNVVIYDRCQLGDRVTLHAGTVIGEDGLGYAPVDGEWLKIPQAGRVVVEDDVEMGANCALNRATLGETSIGKGTKFSDLVVIGHGTKVGERCMFVAQVGIAGSVEIGDNVTLAGQVGVCGHLRIGDNVVVGAKSVVWSTIDDGEHYLGFPATDTYQYRRQVAHVQRLPEMKQQLRRLESEVKRLRERLDEK